MSQKENDSMWARPARVELGCQTRGQCFCTGRCQRTAEEQAAHEAHEALRARPPTHAGAPDYLGIRGNADAELMMPQHFEPKPGHGPSRSGDDWRALARLAGTPVPRRPPGFRINNGETPETAARAEKPDSWESPGLQFEPEPASALDTQVGGEHYKKLGDYQPWAVLKAWLTPEEFRGYMKGTAIAYLARERDKGGDQDVEKAAHTLQGLIEISDFREVGK